MRRILSLTCLALILCAIPSYSQSASAPEARTARAYQAAVKAGPAALRVFLAEFPKGADLHNHLSGAVYAETFLQDAAEDNMCIDPAKLAIVSPPCKAPLLSATDVEKNQDLYDRLINAFSMRSFVPTTGFSGHDQFFSTFGRFQTLNPSHAGEWVDEVASRAAAQNEQYLELMYTPTFSHAIQIAHEIGWPEQAKQFPVKPEVFATLREKLLAAGLRHEVDADREEIRNAEAARNAREHCDVPFAASACKVEVRYLYQVLRGNLPEQVFAQTLLGFETIQAAMHAHEHSFVGINFVMPEDGYLSMRDYSLHMAMLNYLHGVYPEVPIALHAGELTQGLVTPEGLGFHIRKAVEQGHALRIGHGIDIQNEDDASGLLKEMALKHIMVEINLTSNEGILGIKGEAHPFTLYRAAHVPVALSTDDEGVSRIDLTHEYVRAAQDYHLSYAELKKLARTGLEHAFLPGQSLWASEDVFTAPIAACKTQQLGIENPSATCRAFLQDSEKAAVQWKLEKQFREFEKKH